MRAFQFSEGTSNKFWNIELKGKTLAVNFGRIGSAGQSQTKEFADEAAARKEHDKLVAEKLRKGYTETTKGGPQTAAPATAKVEKPAKAAKVKEEPAKAEKSAKAAKASEEPAPAAALAAPPAPAAASGGKRTFEYSDATSHKFWAIEATGPTSFTVSYGRIGTAGQTQEKTFADEAKAKKESDKLVAEKTGKGYRETTPAAKAPASLRESLEQALTESPDELANHMAYADYLSEQGDPLGEFVRVQLALEDPSRPAAERKKLQQQEKKLLDAHARAWLGELAPFCLGDLKDPEHSWRDIQVEYTFRRGWLSALKVSRFTVAFTRALARSLAARLLQRLHLEDQGYEEPGEYEAGDDIPEEGEQSPQFYPLLRSHYLGNVRVFLVGEEVTEEYDRSALNGGFNSQTDGEAAVGVVKQMPKLEELHLCARGAEIDQLFSLRTLNNLRVLRVYHARSYPLARLAKNPSLGKLTHLLLHPHGMDDEPYLREPAVRALVNADTLPALTHLQIRLSDMGDKGVKTIVASGILKRLKVLDLQHGCVSDEGARALAACPDVKRLQKIDLTNNRLTEEGIEALQATGVTVVAPHQWRPGDEGANWSAGDQEYLYAGDIE